VFDYHDRRGSALDSMVSGGCIVSGATVRRSMLFSGVHVHSHTLVEDSLVLPNVQIARHCVLRKCIIDKDCQIAEGTHIGVDAQADRKRYRVTPSGITLVTKEMLEAV
jgi:glucose-1-phosphate adenylyltransferase